MNDGFEGVGIQDGGDGGGKMVPIFAYARDEGIATKFST